MGRISVVWIIINIIACFLMQTLRWSLGSNVSMSPIVLDSSVKIGDGGLRELIETNITIGKGSNVTMSPIVLDSSVKIGDGWLRELIETNITIGKKIREIR